MEITSTESDSFLYGQSLYDIILTFYRNLLLIWWAGWFTSLVSGETKSLNFGFIGITSIEIIEQRKVKSIFGYSANRWKGLFKVIMVKPKDLSKGNIFAKGVAETAVISYSQ